MKQELDNAQKVERYTLKQKLDAQLKEKEKELEAVTWQLTHAADFRTFNYHAARRASLTVDIANIGAMIKNINKGKPIHGEPTFMNNAYFLKLEV